MAHFSQARKAQLAPAIKAICKKYGVKATMSVRNHMTFAVTITQGEIDFIGNFNQTVSATPRYMADPLGYRPVEKYIDVNPYWFQDHFTGEAKAFLTELLAAMNVGNHDRSDIQTDYFDVGWYVDVNIGRWDKPYALAA
jgi:hypothetical protein